MRGIAQGAIRFRNAYRLLDLPPRLSDRRL